MNDNPRSPAFRIENDDAKIEEYLTSLGGHVLSIEVFGPQEVPPLLMAMQAGDRQAFTTLTEMDACIKHGLGMECIACDVVIDKIVGGAVVVIDTDPGGMANARLAFPLCVLCAFLPPGERTAKVKGGLARSVFSDAKFLTHGDEMVGRA